MKKILFLTIFIFGLFFLPKIASAATNVYYSVGQNVTDHKTGSPTVTIDAAGLGTFSVAQVETNLGVGDKVTYGGAIAYISSKIDTSNWNLITATGTIPVATTTATVTSIAHAFSSLNAAVGAYVANNATSTNYMNTSNMVTGNFLLNIPCYYDTGPDTTTVFIAGYTVDSTHYIHVYTPNNTSTEVNQTQRHSGVWSDTKYRLSVTSGWTNNLMTNSYARIEGLQCSRSGSGSGYPCFQGDASSSDGPDLFIDNIAKATGSAKGVADCFQAYSNGTHYFENNLAYDCLIGFDNQFGPGYYYNNTAKDNGRGFYQLHKDYAMTIINGLADSNTTADFSTITGGILTMTYSASKDGTADDWGGASNRAGQTFTFGDAANDDFHLAYNDAGARNFGTPLSGLGTYPFSTDIDGQTRPSSYWDIGADEASNNVYYSVGQNTNNHSSGGNVSISNGVATFTVAQTAANLGVGDRLTYGGHIAYLATTTDTTHWSVVTALGVAADNHDLVAVTSIAHEYTSLSAAEAGASDIDHLNTSDLITGGYILNFPCYYDSAADGIKTTIAGWTTGAGSYIKVYTPSNTLTEVNQSQRHNGKWKTDAYRLEISNDNGLVLSNNFIRIEGLQIQLTLNNTNGKHGFHSTNGAYTQISYNIIKGVLTGTSDTAMGIYFYNANEEVKAWNNIIYNFVNGTYDCVGMTLRVKSGSLIYNNTVFNSRTGYWTNVANAVLKNNIAQGNASTSYYGTWASASSNNVSGDASYASSTTDRTSKNVVFANETAGSEDLHLASTDTEAKDYGTDLSADSSLAFSTDIDGEIRPQGSAWDIGADETGSAPGVNANVFYSVGQNSSHHETGSSTVSVSSGVATFSIAQTATNMGVGDRVTYGNGLIAYISAKQSTTVWNVVTANGGMPPNISSVGVVSIAHEYTSLSAAIAGAYDANHLNTTNLTSGSGYILNLPCYYDSGPDTTAVTVSGYTTGASNYINIYTPTDTSTEVNQTQRHSGVWSDTKYNLTHDAYWETILSSQQPYTRITGIQIYNSGSANGGGGIFSDWSPGYAHTTIDKCIIRFSANKLNCTGANLRGDDTMTNTIIYTEGTSDYGLYSQQGGSPDVYNVTIVGFTTGVLAEYSAGAVYKNVLVSGGTTGFNVNATGNTITYSASSDGTADDIGGDGNIVDKVFTFAGAGDYHLDPNDAGARDHGIDLSVTFTDDIDGQIRPTGANTWDIGADETTQSEPPIEAAPNTTAPIIFKPNVILKPNVIFK